MKSLNIKLDSIDKVKDFVNVINTFDGDFDLASNRYVVDAKSIMGIFSLDVSTVLRLDVHDDSEFDAVKSALSQYEA
ncbi:MAG: HPr family phosphocarrier protein [Clostridia bacterium]|nr:HPr family phosphocarrier protein [Clostridia bacterium]